MTDSVIDAGSVFIAPGGVQFRLRKVSRLLIYDQVSKAPMPKPPVQFNPDKERDEENPLDPDYVAALSRANIDVGIRSAMIALAFGTAIDGELPVDIPAMEDDEWADMLIANGVEVEKKNRIMRYGLWLKYIVLADSDVFTALVRRVLRYSGLSSEEDVAEAEKSFRRDEEGNPTTGVVVTTGSPGGHNGRKPERVGAGA